MHSMTGYGKADCKKKKLVVSAELFSVNSRYLEYSFRIPKALSFVEPKLKKLIASKVNRGKITVAINYADYGTGIDKLIINTKLADEIHTGLLALKRKYKLSGEIEIAHLLDFQDIFRIEKTDKIEDIVWPIVKTAAEIALKDLNKMRLSEGVNLKKDLTMRLKILSGLIDKVEKFAPENVKQYRDKLTKRISEALVDKTINGKKMEEEVAHWAERSDITEECVRFKSHIKQFGTALKDNCPIGKRLNFILQELNRETNTIAAKAGGSDISQVILRMKEEIEKMREQVQNIE